MTPQVTHLVLLPGLDGTGELFADLVQALPKAFVITIVCYPANRRLPYAKLVPFIEESLPAHPYILVAESFSVPLAIRIAGSSTANLRGLILCAGFATSPIQGVLKHLISLLGPVLFALPMPGFAAEYFLIGKKSPSNLRKALRDALAKVETTVLVHRLREVLACDVTAVLSCLQLPMLYVQATQDRLVDDGAFDAMHRVQSQLAIAVVHGPHLILQREPERCAQTITAFVESL